MLAHLKSYIFRCDNKTRTTTTTDVTKSGFRNKVIRVAASRSSTAVAGVLSPVLWSETELSLEDKLMREPLPIAEVNSHIA